jgi:hypothetical protein
MTEITGTTNDVTDEEVAEGFANLNDRAGKRLARWVDSAWYSATEERYEDGAPVFEGHPAFTGGDPYDYGNNIWPSKEAIVKAIEEDKISPDEVYRLLREEGVLSEGEAGKLLIHPHGGPEVRNFDSSDAEAIADDWGGEPSDLPFIDGDAIDASRLLGYGGPDPDVLARRRRRRLRQDLDDALEAEGYDPDEWNTDARADGTLILQDPETNKTKTIEPDSGESGIDSAVESLDSSSDSSTSDSDSTGGEQDSSPGGGADGLGQVGGIMLVAAIATAVYYGVTQL